MTLTETAPQATRTGSSTALDTDHYELTALEAALASGVANCDATFELFTRRLPTGRRYGVVGGMAQALEGIRDFRFDDADLAWLTEAAFLAPTTIDWLADYRFSGDVDGYAEGELFFPHSPILTVSSSFAEALVLETMLLSTLNGASAVASAAARMTTVANGRRIIEGGGRRTASAATAARAAYIAGFDATSNLRAGQLWQIPTAGTTMHAYTLAHRSELDAFEAQARTLGCGSTFLVDTYDIASGIDNAVTACATLGGVPGAIRIDSGDLAVEATAARARLDAAGCATTKIIVSGDLDEHRLASLGDAPIDGYVVGTAAVTGSGAPTADMVYKLVAIASVDDPHGPQRDVAKASANKASIGGRKAAVRRLDEAGYAYEEAVTARRGGVGNLGDGPDWRALTVPLIRNGEIVADTTAAAARRRCATSLAELRPTALAIADGRPALDGAR